MQFCIKTRLKNFKHFTINPTTFKIAGIARCNFKHDIEISLFFVDLLFQPMWREIKTAN